MFQARIFRESPIPSLHLSHDNIQVEGQPTSLLCELRLGLNVDNIQMKIPRSCHINCNNNQIIHKIFTVTVANCCDNVVVKLVVKDWFNSPNPKVGTLKFSFLCLCLLSTNFCFLFGKSENV